MSVDGRQDGALPCETVALVAPDINGGLRARHIPVSAFDSDATPNFSDIIFAFDDAERLIPRPDDYDGWWPSWDGGFGDLITTPDLSSRRNMGWRNGYDVVFADLAHADGTPVEVAPRGLLRRAVADLTAANIVALVGVEIEFFLHDADLGATGDDEATTAYALSPPPRDNAAMTDIVASLTASQIGVASWYSEGGPRQYEIALDPADPLTAADLTVLTRAAITDIAAVHGLRASFAPKVGDGFGSGLHTHISLHDSDGTNLLEPLTRESRPSDGSCALAGLLDVLKPASALLIPSPQGYRRMVPHAGAGTTATWGDDNRSAGVRYLHRGRRSRFEVRVASSDANPYLVLAALFAGMIDGLHSRPTLPPPGRSDLYRDAPPETALPTDLLTAVAEMRKSAPLNAVLGTGFIDYFAQTRLWTLQRDA